MIAIEEYHPFYLPILIIKAFEIYLYNPFTDLETKMHPRKRDVVIREFRIR
jgi:hypothetical protein